VFVGKSSNAEVDFVAEKQGTYTYFQVTADMKAQETFEREIAPLRNINDNYQKIILTLDHFTIGNYDGIQVIYLLDWLLDKDNS
jgi:predicted AAA+ superfamily ATPase